MGKLYLCLTGRMDNCIKCLLVVMVMGVGGKGFCKNLVYHNSAITDYFRSNTANTGSGASWSQKSSWESSNDNITWTPATEVPSSAANTITIRNGFNIDIKSGSESADQLIIEAGATLTFSNGSFTLEDGAGTDMILAGSNSNFVISSNSDPMFIGGSTIRINSNAKITLSGTSNIALYQSAQFVYADGSNFEYSGGTTPGIQIIFFQSQDPNAVPLFIYNSPVSTQLGGGAATSINGKLEVSSGRTMNVSGVIGTLIVRNGIIGAGNYVNSTSTITNITGSIAEIGGTGNLDSYVTIANGSTTTLTSNKQYLNNNIFIVNGIYDLGTYRMSSPSPTSTITVGSTGTLRTANVNGLTGAGSIGTNLALSTLPIGSTVEYYSTAAQVVTALSYQNIILNGNSTKTASGPLTFGANAQAPVFNINAGSLFLEGGVTFVTGTTGVMTIATGATLNTANATNQLTGSNTASIQVNGKFVTQHTGGFIGTSTAVPGIPVILNTNSTVEFGGTNQAFQNLVSGNVTGLPTNIIFSGSSIKTGANISTLSPGLISITNNVIVNATAGANFGVTGAALTMEALSKLIIAGSGTQPNMGGLYTLDPTSTIEFAGTSGSAVRLSPTYAQVIVSGTNVSNTGTTGVKFKAGGSFTVKNGATFNLSNSAGFSNTTGSGSTAISNVAPSNPTITLEPNSVINYAGTAAQTITNVAVSNPTTGNYYNLTLSGSDIKSAPAGNLIILGDLYRSGTHTFNAGTGRLIFGNTTTAQKYFASTGVSDIDFYDVTNSNTSSAGISVDATFGVLHELSNGSLNKLLLNTGDIILRSKPGINITASIPSLGITGAGVSATNISYNTGRFMVERYLFKQKSWRFLSVPLLKLADDASSPTINDSWREGGLAPTSTGYGTRVTGPGLVGNPGGVDEYTQRGSMKYYDRVSNNYKEISSTDLAANKTISNDEGYYIFVRGDRGINVLSGATGATTLRARGKIRTGDQTFNVNANSFQSVGNPYPSRLQFANITKTGGTEDAFIIWNPLNSGGGYGVGRFEQYANISGSYKGTFGTRNFIESGEAFFISATATNGSLIIKEADKAAGSANLSRVGVFNPTLEINLFARANDNTEYKADGTSLNFDPSFSNTINNEDVKKFSNASDNVFIVKNSTKLFAERRPPLEINDTIFFAISNTRVAPYRFEIDPSVLENTPLTAYLLDKFLQTETEVSLTSNTNVDFLITADAASKAADRFMIVFKQAAAGALPVNFTTITAEKNNDKSNIVKWSCSNEINLRNYIIERSDNTNLFTTVGDVTATGSNNYSFIDVSPFIGVNYYRVKANSSNGQVQYSPIVKILPNNKLPLFTVQPNPVVNKTLHIYFENMKGNYNIKLVAKNGTTFFVKLVRVLQNNEVKIIEVGPTVAAGMYDVIINNGKDNTISQSVYVK